MAAIHRLKIESDILKTGAVSPLLLEELFRTVDESISFTIEVAGSTAATSLPGFGSGAAQIETIQTLLVLSDQSVTLNINGANISMVVSTGNRYAAVLLFGISTTTVPTIANSGSSTANIIVLGGGT